MSAAPYHAVIVPTSVEGELYETALTLYRELQNQNVDVLLDDRKERPGVKFKDADLIGMPLRITVGKSYLEKQEYELKIRHSGEVLSVAKDSIISVIKNLVQQ